MDRQYTDNKKIPVAGEIDPAAPAAPAAGPGPSANLDMSGGLINLPTVASSWFLPCRGSAGEASVVNVSGGTVENDHIEPWPEFDENRAVRPRRQ